jgi:hypothetical protein
VVYAHLLVPAASLGGRDHQVPVRRFDLFFLKLLQEEVTAEDLRWGAILVSSAVRRILVVGAHVRLSRIGDLYRYPVASDVAVLQQHVYPLDLDALDISERTRGDGGGLVNGLFTASSLRMMGERISSCTTQA